MKAQCEKCKEIVPLVFAVEGGAIRVTCPSCAAVYGVAGAQPETPTPTPPSADLTCPKCGEAQTKAEACRRCGLVFARWRPSVAAAAVPAADAAAVALFTACTERWDDAARHDAFIAHCSARSAFAHAAACYRRASADPGRREVALARLDEIRRAAEKVLVAPPRSEPRPKRPWRTLIAAAILLIVAIAAVQLIATRMLSSGPRGDRPRAPRAGHQARLLRPGALGEDHQPEEAARAG